MIECVMLDTLPEKANLILNILWDRNHPMSVTELIEALKEEFSLNCEKEEVQDYLRFLLASDYVEKKRLEADGALAEAEGGKTRTQLDKEKRRERLKQESARTLKLKLKQAEQAIANAEERIAQLEARMADPETYKSPDAAQKLAQEHRDAQEALDALYSDWEELSEAVSELP